MSHNHYFKDVSGLQQIDVYRVIELFDVPAGPIDHAVKKLLCAGNRGHKDLDRDIQDAIDSLVRWQAMRAEDQKAEFGQQNTIDCRTEAEKAPKDPRTVAGVDVSFETEKHMNFAPECGHQFEDHGCYRFGSRGQQLTILNCAKCGAEQVEAEDE